MKNPQDLAGATADQLTARLYELRAEERHLLVEFLTYLAEVDRRKLYLEMAFPSLFAMCTSYLGYTSSSAYRRVAAARLLARFPVVAEYLWDGRLCLTTLVELREVLTEERREEILGRAAGRTEDEVRELVAALRPQPAPLDLFRRLPTPAAPVDTAGPAVEAVPVVSPLRPPGRIEPVSEELRVLRVTVGKEFAADLEKVRAALSHQIPDGRLESVLHHCLRITLEACERRRRGTGRRGKGGKGGKGRYIPAAVRDEVWRRDEGMCAFVSETGRRCGSTKWLELHHLQAYATGGPATVENLSLRCGSHNRYHAEQELGADRIGASRELRVSSSSSSTVPGRPGVESGRPR